MKTAKTARILAALVLTILPSFTLAFTIQSGEVVNVATPVTDDLYVAGSRVSIESPITGDLIMAGADLSSEQNISSDVMVAGANLNLGGQIGDDLRAAGANLRIHSTIRGDAILAGGNIDLQKEASVGNDLVVAGGNVYLDGVVNGKAEIMGGKIYLRGTIGGDVRIRAGEIIVASGATIRGNLIYESPRANPILEAIVVGQKQFIQIKDGQDYAKKAIGFASAYILFKILFLTIFGFLLLSYFERYFRETSDIMRRTPWMSLFTGIAFFVLVPIGAVLFALTIIGIPISVLLIMTFVLTLLFYELIGTIIFGSWVLGRMGDKDSA